jgi:hypothetical protein
LLYKEDTETRLIKMNARIVSAKIVLQTPAAYLLSVPTLNAEQAVGLWFPRKTSYVQYHRNEFTDHSARMNEAVNSKQ